MKILQKKCNIRISTSACADIVYTCFPWFGLNMVPIYKMVTQKMLRTYDVK